MTVSILYGLYNIQEYYQTKKMIYISKITCTAKKNVDAGRELTIAAANVADV